MIKDLIYQLKNIYRFSKIPYKHRDIVFFSEGKNYFYVFKKYIDIFINNKKIIFITQDKEDPIFSYASENLKIIYCKNIYLLIIFMNNIKCKNLIMTMPDLNNYELKKSRNVKNYIYFFHSLVSTHMIYRYKAFNSYDKIFCITQNQFDELQQNKITNSLKYELFKSNYPKLDVLNYENKAKVISNLISIAPSWGNNNIFENEKFEIFLRNLIKQKYKVILRPHSHATKKIKNKLFLISKNFDKDELLFEENNANFKNTFASNFLITDWSGVALEYAFVTKRPVIFINTNKKINNKFYKDNDPQRPLEVEIRNKIGAVFDIDEYTKIFDFMKNFNDKEFATKLKEIQNRTLFQNEITEKNFTHLLD
jgi:hypothetical protein